MGGVDAGTGVAQLAALGGAIFGSYGTAPMQAPMIRRLSAGVTGICSGRSDGRTIEAGDEGRWASAWWFHAAVGASST